MSDNAVSIDFLKKKTFQPPIWGTFILTIFTVQYITLFADYMVELQLCPSDPPYLQLLPSFSVPAYQLHLLTSEQGPFGCCTLFFVCCQATSSLLIIAAFTDEAAANLSAVVVLLLPSYCTIAAQALLQLLLMKLLLVWLFFCWA